MKDNADPSPDLRDVLLHIKKLFFRSKTITFCVLALCAGCAVLLLARPDPPTWNLRATFHIGNSSNAASLIQDSLTLQGTVERYALVVGLISNPGFRQAIADTSEFEPGSAALSKKLVFSTLRASALNDNDIGLEITAASAADCRSAYRNIAKRIEQRHASFSDENARVLKKAIDDYRERSVQLKKWEDALARPDTPSSNEHANDTAYLRSGLGVSWNETREHLRRLEAIELLTTPTRFPAESEVYVDGPLSNNSARLSSLAGIIVVLCALMLALGLEMRQTDRRKREA